MMGRNEKAETTFHYRWKKDPAAERFATGVSLHGHTWYSHEGLAFLPDAIKKFYLLPRLLNWAEGRYKRKWNQPFDYSLGYWTSPVSPEAAYALEASQISAQSLRPLISLSDHDSITAHGNLPTTPISLEWTVPYNGAVFHVGVHNLPPGNAKEIFESLRGYSTKPDPKSLEKILADLDSIPNTLVILNHPLSDQGRIGFEIHESRIDEFLKHYGRWIHALEVNAMQPWSMNRHVSAIAKEFKLPVISGGDRHSFEPNGAINLTDAKTFAEFVDEIRKDKESHVLFMPQMRRSLTLRYAENVKAIMEEYPELTGRVSWYDRVFYKCPDGVTRSFTQMVGNHGAFDAMDFAVDALGVVTFIIRPITPIFAEPAREIA